MMTMMPLGRRLCAAALLLLGAASLVDGAVHTNLPRPNPFIDPAHDPYNPLKYIASNTLTGIAFCASTRALSFCCHSQVVSGRSHSAGVSGGDHTDGVYHTIRGEVDDVDDYWGVLYARQFSAMVSKRLMRGQCSPLGCRFGSACTSTHSPRGSTSSSTCSSCSRYVSMRCILSALYLRIFASRARSSPQTMCCSGAYPSISGRTSTSSSLAGGSLLCLSRRTLLHS